MMATTISANFSEQWPLTREVSESVGQVLVA